MLAIKSSTFRRYTYYFQINQNVNFSIVQILFVIYSYVIQYLIIYSYYNGKYSRANRLLFTPTIFLNKSYAWKKYVELCVHSCYDYDYADYKYICKNRFILNVHLRKLITCLIIIIRFINTHINRVIVTNDDLAHN